MGKAMITTTTADLVMPAQQAAGEVLILVRCQAILFQFREHCLVIDLESLGRLGFVASVGVEDALDVEAFDLLQGQVRVISRLKRVPGFRQ